MNRWIHESWREKKKKITLLLSVRLQNIATERNATIRVNLAYSEWIKKGMFVLFGLSHSQDICEEEEWENESEFFFLKIELRFIDLKRNDS